MPTMLASHLYDRNFRHIAKAVTKVWNPFTLQAHGPQWTMLGLPGASLKPTRTPLVASASLRQMSTVRPTSVVLCNVRPEASFDR